MSGRQQAAGGRRQAAGSRPGGRRPVTDRRPDALDPDRRLRGRPRDAALGPWDLRPSLYAAHCGASRRLGLPPTWPSYMKASNSETGAIERLRLVRDIHLGQKWWYWILEELEAEYG